MRLHVRLSGRTAEALGLCAVRSLFFPRPSVSLQSRGEEGGEVLGHLERIDSDVDRGNALGRTLLAWLGLGLGSGSGLWLGVGLGVGLGLGARVRVSGSALGRAGL